MHIHQNSKNSNYDKLQALSCDQSVCSDLQLSPEQFDKAAHDAMLDMLSIDRNYYYQISTSNELV